MPAPPPTDSSAEPLHEQLGALLTTGRFAQPTRRRAKRQVVRFYRWLIIFVALTLLAIGFWGVLG